MRFILALLLTVMCASINEALAVPETHYPTAFSVIGTSTSARFGESIACSHQMPLGNTYQYVSLVAVGAPGSNNGLGAVFIYNPDNPNTPVQGLISPSGFGANKHFGAAVAFIKDANHDQIDELVVGEPNSGGQLSGSVHVYLSQPGALPYNPAPLTISDSSGFGVTILGLRSSVLPAPYFVVSNSFSQTLSSYYVDCSGSPCQVLRDSSRFSSSGLANYGFSLSELPPNIGSARIVVGSISEAAAAGVVYDLQQDDTQTHVAQGLAGEQFGYGVAGNKDSVLGTYLAFSGPGGNKVGVADALSHQFGCAVTIPMVNIPATSRWGLVHQGGAFNSLFALLGAGSTTFASYRDEAVTGGSIGIFGVGGVGGALCSEVYQVNNCQLDVNQEQGHTLVGDDACVGDQLNPKKMLLSGAPGFNSDTGRVDAYFAGQQYGSAQGCGEPTATPTYTPTYTPTHTPTPTYTPTSVTTSTPSPTPTPLATQASEVPIEIDPSVNNLPPPVVTDEGVTVSVSVPYTFSYSQAFIKKVRAFLQKATRKKLTDDKTVQELNKVAFFDYFAVPTGAAARTAYALGGAYSDLAVKSKVIKIRSRLNRVTLGRLAPGQRYSVTYQRTFDFKKYKKTFSTKMSAPTLFTKSG